MTRKPARKPGIRTSKPDPLADIDLDKTERSKKLARERKARQRKNQKQSGLVRVELMLTPNQRDAVLEFVAELERKE